MLIKYFLESLPPMFGWVMHHDGMRSNANKFLARAQLVHIFLNMSVCDVESAPDQIKEADLASVRQPGMEAGGTGEEVGTEVEMEGLSMRW